MTDKAAISAGGTGQPEENNAYSVDSSAGDNPVFSSDGDNSRQVLSPAPQLRDENERLNLTKQELLDKGNQFSEQFNHALRTEKELTDLRAKLEDQQKLARKLSGRAKMWHDHTITAESELASLREKQRKSREALTALVELIEAQTSSPRCQWIQTGPTFAQAKRALAAAPETEGK